MFRVCFIILCLVCLLANHCNSLRVWLAVNLQKCCLVCRRLPGPMSPLARPQASGTLAVPGSWKRIYEVIGSFMQFLLWDIECIVVLKLTLRLLLIIAMCPTYRASCSECREHECGGFVGNCICLGTGELMGLLAFSALLDQQTLLNTS